MSTPPPPPTADLRRFDSISDQLDHNFYSATKPRSSILKTCVTNQTIQEWKILEKHLSDSISFRLSGLRPLGFLPFASIALVLSLVGAIIWIIKSANLAMGLIKLPVRVLWRFIDQIPC
ncbi:hypothetical protein LINGRAHAP2_LOCUS2671 [Linum grandiflorum]